VAISSPPHGVQLEVGETIMVEAAAIGSLPFQSMELWINGELMGVQAAPSGGAQPFSTYFSWVPVETGIYSLIAATTDEGNKEMSSQVVVFVTQRETGSEFVSFGSTTVLPAPSGGGYVPPDGPGASDSTGPAMIWEGSIGDWITSLTADVKPAAPELIVIEGECASELQIHDLSDNEEGFVVYRQTGILPMWVQVAALNSQQDVDWIIYTDEGMYGAVTYYVSTFNSKGESKSNLVLVNIDPTDCTSVGKSNVIGTVELTLQIPTLGAQQVYCYRSLDGLTWDRWPQFGFL
jgi:hypothetical protein